MNMEQANQERRLRDIVPARKPGRLERLRAIVPPFVPGGMSRERLASNGVLQQFLHRFSLVPVPFDRPLSQGDRERMSESARRLVAGDVVNDQALVEVRPMIPAEELWGGLGKSALTAVEVVKDGLRDRGMSAIPNSHPITPTEEFDEEADPMRVWHTIGGEMDSLSHQARASRGVRNAALITVVDPRFAERIFGSQIVSEERFHEDGQPVVLSRVSDDPSGNILAPVAAA